MGDSSRCWRPGLEERIENDGVWSSPGTLVDRDTEGVRRGHSELRSVTPVNPMMSFCSPLRVGGVTILGNGNKRRSWKAALNLGWNPNSSSEQLLTSRDQGATAVSTPTQPACSPHPPTAQRLMEDAEKGEKGEKESPPLQIDPKWCVRHLRWRVADR